MRTNIVIDPALMAQAMKAGPYKTKKDAVEAGLKLLARQAAYREILKWEGKLHWDGDDESSTAAAAVSGRSSSVLTVQEPAVGERRGRR